MQKRFLVTALIFVLGFSAVWLYLAEKFETMVETEVKTILAKDNGIIKTNLDEMKVDKYKFKIHLGHFDLLPNNETMSYSFEEAEISYNPFKDKFTITPSGDKILTRNTTSSYYIKDPKMSISFDGALISKNLLDSNYAIEIKQKNLKLHSKDSDDLVSEQDSGTVILSHKKNNDKHVFRIEVEAENPVLHKNSEFDKIYAPMIKNQSDLEGFKKDVLALINEIFAGKSNNSIVEFTIPDSSLELLKEDFKNFEDLMAGNIQLNPMALMAVASGELGVNIAFNTNVGTKNPGKFILNIDKKSGNNFSVTTQSDMHIDEKFNEICASIISASYSDTTRFVINKDEILALMNKHYLGNRSSVISFNFSAGYVHDLKITHNGKVAELKGKKDAESGVFDENLSIDNLIGLIDYSQSYANDVMGIIHIKADDPKMVALFNNTLSDVSKSLEILASSTKELVKLLHKGNELNLGDTFKSDFKIALIEDSLSLTEINGKSTEELFSSPEFMAIIQNFEKAFKTLGEQPIELLESSMDTEATPDAQLETVNPYDQSETVNPDAQLETVNPYDQSETVNPDAQL